MTEAYSDSSNRKKLLVPLVALLICGVAFTGAAYAYSSSISTSQDISAHSFEISTDKDTARVVDLKLSDLEFSTTITDGAASYKLDNGTQKVTFYMVNAENTQGMTLAVTELKLDSAAAQYLDITSTVTDNGTNSVVTIKITVKEGVTIDESIVNALNSITVTLAVEATGIPSA